MSEQQRFLIISGQSGAGKSVVLHALEDFGFYCVDNLPVGFLSEFAREVQLGENPYYRESAIGIDARSPAHVLAGLPRILSDIKAGGLPCELIFVHASDDALIQRFSETRRRHPLSQGEVSLATALEAESNMLAPLRAVADMSIDTSKLDVHQLRELVRVQVALRKPGRMAVQIVSFGYKHGIPPDADIVFDMRGLPNPYWDPSLRVLTGRHRQVREFLERVPAVAEMLSDVASYLEKWLPRFEQEDRSYITVAIGCTGGRHRSVYVSEELGNHLRRRNLNCYVRHRDLA